MRTLQKTYLYLFILSSGLLIFSSCLKEEVHDNPIQETPGIEELTISDNFFFETSRDVEVSINVKDNSGFPISKIPVYITTASYDELSGEYVNEEKLYTALTSSTGQIQANIKVASYLDELIIKTNFIGIPNYVSVAIENNRLQYTYNNESTAKNKGATESFGQNQNGYLTLGTWNSIGVPNYLETVGDVISTDFLSDINASLPEGTPLPTSHPMYFNSSNEFALRLTDSCDVWVTFVHEGAGWKNALGFYYYNELDPPAHQDSITNKTIIFPNTSYAGSGGGLYSGDKVYLGAYGAGTVIEWFLVGQGWNQNTQTVGNGVYTHYSNKSFNVETDPNLQQHTVLLWDETREIILLGFEDIRRDAWSDEDFNDAVYYASANPIESVETENFQPIDTPDDTDNDGVSNTFDEYPNDPSKAYNYHMPSENEFGTLAFEDLWPSKGDYDFNDLVIDYNYKIVANADNEAITMEARYVLRAIGATYHNGFGIELAISPNMISSVTGGHYPDNIVSLGANGTELNQTNAVIIAFENGFKILGYPGDGIGVNTSPNATYVQPDTLTQLITFENGVSVNSLGTAPFNPFIFVDQNRSREVHLPGQTPTDLANTQLFGTSQDDSNPGMDRYYQTTNNLPWAIHIIESFDYPVEKSPINTAHLKFTDWAESAGALYNDWYQEKQAYRTNLNIYQP